MALGGDLLRPFLEWWLGMEGKHVATLGSGLVVMEIQCEYTSCGSYWLTPLNLHSRVADYDVGNLVLRIRIVVHIRELQALWMVVRNRIFSHV